MHRPSQKCWSFAANARSWCRARICVAWRNFFTAKKISHSHFLSDITGVDRFPVEPRFELNYHLVSIPHRAVLCLRVRAHGNDPVVPSVTTVWSTANWHEREIFDLFGVRFEGHPDLRRILMPEDWEGYPLRKDYPVEGPR